MTTGSMEYLLAGVCVCGLLVGCAARGGGSSAGEGAAAQADEGTADGDSTANSNGVDETDSENGDDAFEFVGDATTGAALYANVVYGCFVCHGEGGGGTAQAPEPIRDASAAVLQTTLGVGGLHTGGSVPDFTAQDFADLAAFLSGPGPDVSTNGSTPIDTGTNGSSAS